MKKFNARTERKRKEYLDPYNRAKLRINRHYARWVRKYLGTEAQHLILDSEFCVTSKFLVDEGFAHQNIYAPNMNRDECVELEKYGVRAPHMTIERFVKKYLCGDNAAQVRPVITALWYDSMTNMSGNETENYYAGVVVDGFLKHNRGHECTIAITLATRSNQPQSIHGDCKSTALDQIERLIAIRGFCIDSSWHSVYKKNMLYAVWNLKYDPMNVQPTALLQWKDGSKRYIGFPRSYVP